MNEINPLLVEKVALAIQSDLQLTSLPELSCKLIYADDRKIYRFDVIAQQAFYILKIRGNNAVKTLDLDADDLLKEYSLLSQAWKSAQHMQANYSMSRPLAIWPDYKAILLSGCVGENFNSMFNQKLVSWSIKPAPLQQALFHVGVWLGNFHSHSCRLASLQESFDNRLRHLTRMLNVLRENSNNPLKHETLTQIEQHFLAMYNLQEQDYVGLVHGNFAYRNILYQQLTSTTHGVELVDFEDAHTEHAGYDAGQFIAEILFKSQFPWIRPHTKRFVSAFIKGYQQQNNLNESILQSYIGYHLIVHLYEHCGRKKSSFIKQLVIRWRTRYLAKLIKKWLLNH